MKEECKYCRSEHCDPIYDTRNYYSNKGDFFPGWDVYIDKDILELTAVPDVYEPGFMETTIKINYCPMCGRKLN